MRIQQMMVKSLYDISKQSLKDYPDEDPLNKQKWLFSFSAQVILLVDQIKWTEGVTNAVLNQQTKPKEGIAHFESFMK